jgi:predicted ATPase
VDALYDSEEGDTIVIDEPELSLHPSLQRRLAILISDVARTRQIICATHSPYFITPEALLGGAIIARSYLLEHSSKIAHLSPATAQALVRLAVISR